MNKYININFLKLFDKEKNVTSIHKILYIRNDNHLVTLNEPNDKKSDKSDGVSLTNYFALDGELFLLKKINEKKNSLHYLIIEVNKEKENNAVLLREFIYKMTSNEYFYKYKNDIIPYLKSLNIVELKENEESKDYLMQINKDNPYNRIFNSILYSLKEMNTYKDDYLLKDLFDIIQKEIPKTLYYSVMKNEIKLDINNFINEKTLIHLKRNKLKNINEVIEFKDEYFERTLRHSLEINFLFIIYKYDCFKNKLPINSGIVKLIKLNINEIIELMEELYNNYYYS